MTVCGPYTGPYWVFPREGIVRRDKINPGMYKKAAKSLSRRRAGLSWQANPAVRKIRSKIKKAKEPLKPKASIPRARGAELYNLPKPRNRPKRS
jgi:hypothetical protein